MGKLVIQRSLMESCQFPWLLGKESLVLEEMPYSPEIYVWAQFDLWKKNFFHVFFPQKHATVKRLNWWIAIEFWWNLLPVTLSQMCSVWCLWIKLCNTPLDSKGLEDRLSIFFLLRKKITWQSINKDTKQNYKVLWEHWISWTHRC